LYTQQKNIFSDNKSSKQRIFSWSLWILATIVLIAASLPFIIKQLSIHYFIEQQQVDTAQIGNVDLNLFAGHLVFDNVEIQKTSFEKLKIEKLSINFDWLPLLSQQFLVRSFIIRTANLQLDMRAPDLISINGLRFSTEVNNNTPSEDSTSNSNWQFGLQKIHIVNSHVTIKQKEFDSNIAIEAFTISNLIRWLPAQSTTFKSNLTLDDAPILLEGTAKPFQPTLPLTAHFTVNNLDLSNIQPLLKNNMTALAGTVSAELNISSLFAKENEYDIKIEGYIKSFNFQGTFSDSDIKQDQFTWSGLTQLSLNTRNASFSIFNKGTTELQGLHYTSALTGLTLSSRSTTSEGQFSYESSPINLHQNTDANGNTATATPFHFIGRITAIDFEAIEHKTNIILAAMQSIELPEIELGGINHIDISTLSIQKARFLSENTIANNTITVEANQPQEKGYLLAVNQTVINDFQLNLDKELNITDLVLTGANGELIKQTDGKLQYIDEVISALAIGQAKRPLEPTSNESASPVSPMAIINTGLTDTLTMSSPSLEGKIPDFIVRIGTINVDGDSKFSFKDASVDPIYQTNISNIQLKIVGLNNQDKNQNSQIDLVATGDDNTNIALSGFVQPFSKPINAHIVANIKALELPPLSSYTASTLGYHLKRGQASADLSLNVIHGNLESNNNIIISKLNLEQKSDEDIKNLTEELAMPLDKALDLLRDSKGNITISLPVNGNINDPNFDFSPTINKAMGKAIRSATLSYVEDTLHPWSTLLTVAKIAGKQVNKIKFEPLLFNVGSDQIRKENYDYLNKISKLINDRPELSITVCGVASLQDRLALSRTASNNKSGRTDAINSKTANTLATALVITKKTLLKLAKNRSKNVIRYLVNKKKIASQRLLTCKPTYLNRKSALPSVEIVL